MRETSSLLLYYLPQTPPNHMGKLVTLRLKVTWASGHMGGCPPKIKILIFVV